LDRHQALRSSLGAVADSATQPLLLASFACRYPFSCWWQIETDEQPAVISIASPTIEKKRITLLVVSESCHLDTLVRAASRCGIFRSQLVGVDLIRA